MTTEEETRAGLMVERGMRGDLWQGVPAFTELYEGLLPVDPHEFIRDLREKERLQKERDARLAFAAMVTGWCLVGCMGVVTVYGFIELFRWVVK